MPRGRAARRVALRLRGMSREDRVWLLARLAPDQREAVERASLELQRIVGSAVLDFGLFLDADSTSGLSRGHRVNQIAGSEVQRVLGQLPVHHAGIFLRSGMWTGAEACLKQMSPKRRKAVETAAGAAVTPCAMQALADVIAELAEQQRADEHG